MYVCFSPFSLLPVMTVSLQTSKIAPTLQGMFSCPLDYPVWWAGDGVDWAGVMRWFLSAGYPRFKIYKTIISQDDNSMRARPPPEALQGADGMPHTSLLCLFCSSTFCCQLFSPFFHIFFILWGYLEKYSFVFFHKFSNLKENKKLFL